MPDPQSRPSLPREAGGPTGNARSPAWVHLSPRTRLLLLRYQGDQRATPRTSGHRLRMQRQTAFGLAGISRAGWPLSCISVCVRWDGWQPFEARLGSVSLLSFVASGR